MSRLTAGNHPPPLLKYSASCVWNWMPFGDDVKVPSVRLSLAVRWSLEAQPVPVPPSGIRDRVRKDLITLSLKA